MIRSPKAYRYSVFEATNLARREVYTAATGSSILDTISRLSDTPPADISHWLMKAERVEFRSLCFELPEESARRFVVEMRRSLRPGWTHVGRLAGWRVF